LIERINLVSQNHRSKHVIWINNRILNCYFKREIDNVKKYQIKTNRYSCTRLLVLHKKLPQTSCPKPTEMHSFSFPETQNLKSRYWQGYFLLRAHKEQSFCAFLLLSGHCQKHLEFLDLWILHFTFWLRSSDLWTHDFKFWVLFHVGFLSLYLSKISMLFKDTKQRFWGLT
jgi:hypothetical protein